MQHAGQLTLVRPGGRARSEAAAEDDLVARLWRGRPGALAEAYRVHHAALRGFAHRVTGERALADDLVQEAFLALPRALVTYRGDASLRTLLGAIVIRRARRHRRSVARQRLAMSRLASQPLPGPPPPDDLAGRRELAAALRRGLAALPVAQQDAFLLCSVEGLSSRQAAALVGCPEETLRTRLFHARRKLRAFLEREGFGRCGRTRPRWEASEAGSGRRIEM